MMRSVVRIMPVYHFAERERIGFAGRKTGLCESVTNGRGGTD